MKRTISKTQIMDMVDEACGNMNTFFQQPFLNYRVTAEGTPHSVAEIVADYLLDHPQLLEEIQMIRKEGSYRTNMHDGVTDAPGGKNSCPAVETAMRMFGRNFSGIGQIIDYQTPIKNSRSDRGVGKIDLLSETEDEVYLLTLKKKRQPETLLKCVVEAYTCYRNVDRNKLLEDFGIEGEKTVTGAIIVPKNSALHKEYKRKSTAASKLMDKLGIRMFVITEAIEMA